jgi:hypothetical protein
VWKTFNIPVCPLILFFALRSTRSSETKIYLWKKEKGKTHFTLNLAARENLPTHAYAS